MKSSTAFPWKGRSGRQAAEMIKKKGGVIAGRFTPRVITATALEMGPVGTNSTFINAMK